MLQLKDKRHVKTKKKKKGGEKRKGVVKLAVVHFRGRHGNHGGRASSAFCPRKKIVNVL